MKIPISADLLIDGDRLSGIVLKANLTMDQIDWSAVIDKWDLTERAGRVQ